MFSALRKHFQHFQHFHPAFETGPTTASRPATGQHPLGENILKCLSCNTVHQGRIESDADPKPIFFLTLSVGGCERMILLETYALQRTTEVRDASNINLQGPSPVFGGRQHESCALIHKLCSIVTSTRNADPSPPEATMELQPRHNHWSRSGGYRWRGVQNYRYRVRRLRCRLSIRNIVRRCPSACSDPMGNQAPRR